MQEYNEHEAVPVTVVFFDENGEPFSPDTAEYNVYCSTSKKLVQDWTTITVETVDRTDGTTGYQATFWIPGDTNIIQQPKNARELKKVLVVADRNARENSSELPYYVINLQGR